MVVVVGGVAGVFGGGVGGCGGGRTAAVAHRVRVCGLVGAVQQDECLSEDNLSMNSRTHQNHAQHGHRSRRWREDTPLNRGTGACAWQPCRLNKNIHRASNDCDHCVAKYRRVVLHFVDALSNIHMILSSVTSSQSFCSSVHTLAFRAHTTARCGRDRLSKFLPYC